jgi:hypothetical protein
MAWVYILLLIVIVGAFFIYFYPFPNATSSTFGPYELSTTNTVFDSKQVNIFEHASGTTFQGFFYIVPQQRTPTAMTCNTPGNSSCDDGRFHTCFCGTTNNCSKCERNGYFPILKIGDTCILEILSAPDSGRQGKALTQLAIMTKTNTLTHNVHKDASGSSVTQDVSGSSIHHDAAGAPVVPQVFTPPPAQPLANPNSQFRLEGFTDTPSETYMEFLTLPPIPLQKWVMITIVREGRRFDVYYNNSIVLSQKTVYTPASTTGQAGIITGNKSNGGYCGVLSIKGTADSGAEIASRYTQLSDTRGAPYLTLPNPTNETPTKLPSLCTGCLDTPKIRPAQPWLEWDTNYA